MMQKLFAGALLLFVALSAQAQRSYKSVSIATIVSNDPANWSTISTYVSVSGYLSQKSNEADGDIHFSICDATGYSGMNANHCVNGEIMPYLKCDKLPALGTFVTIRGQVHYDGKEHWWEVHPIESISGLSCYVKGKPSGT